jgi:hypothetical protein
MQSTRWLSVIALVGVVLLYAGRAWAPFHIMAVDEVFFGTADCPNAQYVRLRLLSAGMMFVNNQHITTQNADGSAAGDFGVFDKNAANGANGANILMGTADAAGLFGVEMDTQVSGHLIFPDGRVCFGNFGGQPVDCVAYGNFTGDNGGGGAPAAAPVLGMALSRTSTSGPDSTAFAVAAPAPRNNAGDTGTLGVCPGGVSTPTVTVPGNTPTATVMPTGVPTGTTSACVGDCNDSNNVSIDELVRGVNISLGLQSLSSCEAFDCQHNGMVGVNCLIQGVNNSLDGCS